MGRYAKGKRPPRQPAWTTFAEVEPVGEHVPWSFDPTCELMYQNSRYTVILRVMNLEIGFAGPLHLSIRRNDRGAMRDWRDFQRIKNELAGPDREAFEIFPAENRLVDMSNQYHLWVLPEGDQIGVGFPERAVGGVQAAAKIGAVQRPFEVEPDDLLTEDKVEELMQRRKREKS